MALPKRGSQPVAGLTGWLTLGVFVVGTVVTGRAARREHLHDECLPATCIVHGTTAVQDGSRWKPVLRFHAETPDREPLGRFWLALDPRADTRERAAEIADARWKEQPSFPCYYHPVLREYVTTDAHGHWVFPLVVGLVFLASAIAIARLMWLDVRDRPRPDGDRRYPFDGKNALARAYRARDFLPDEPPPGWSVPIKLRDREWWAVDVGDHGLMITLRRRGPFWAVHAYVTKTGGAKLPEAEALPSDSRCAEILGRLEGLGEWIECVRPDAPATRAWLAFPREQRPRFAIPEGLSFPPQRAHKPRLAAARKFLPEKVPEGWSLPVAISDDHGTAWKDGGWLMAVDETLMALVALCVSEGRDKLAVALFHRDGTDVGDAEAVDVLRHFRGVYEFRQGERAAQAPFVTYLGEIAARRRDPATLN